MSTIRENMRQPRRRDRRETIEHGVIYGLFFAAFLIAAVFGRLTDLVTRRRSQTPHRSIVREARESAGATVPYVFMG